MSATSLERDSLPSLVGSLIHLLEKALTPGEVASLRRMRPGDVSSTVFWRLVAARLEPAGALAGTGPRRDVLEERWQVILGSFAELAGLLEPDARLGQALARAGVAEVRLSRLLRAHDKMLFDQVRVTSRHLAASATPVSGLDVARLVLSDGGPSEEAIRREIARGFYSAPAERP